MLNKVQERFESLTSREKIIVVTTLLVALWSGWDSIFYQPLKTKQKSLQQELVNLNSQIDSQRETATLLQNSVNVDPDAENLKKLAELKNQFTRLQEQVMLGDKKFVPPKLMAKALSDMLKQNGQLKIIKLESLPPTTLLASKQQNQPIYKHGLVITFTGNYADTLKYLLTLEALPWAIVWDSLDYQVKNYPLAEITLRAVTLSFEKGWLGV
jgi:MSHA biogenesis protein MshJ